MDVQHVQDDSAKTPQTVAAFVKKVKAYERVIRRLDGTAAFWWPVPAVPIRWAYCSGWPGIKIGNLV